MKRILSAFIEASVFIACMVWAYRQMPERFESTPSGMGWNGMEWNGMECN